MASGLQKPKPEPEANLGQVVGLAWLGLWLPGQAGASLHGSIDQATTEEKELA